MSIGNMTIAGGPKPKGPTYGGGLTLDSLEAALKSSSPNGFAGPGPKDPKRPFGNTAKAASSVRPQATPTAGVCAIYNAHCWRCVQARKS